MTLEMKWIGKHDAVERPRHYTSHPSGIECIQVTEHMSFCVGNAMKYLWRAALKGGSEDLEKAKWYIEREIQRTKSVGSDTNGELEAELRLLKPNPLDTSG